MHLFRNRNLAKSIEKSAEWEPKQKDGRRKMKGRAAYTGKKDGDV